MISVQDLSVAIGEFSFQGISFDIPQGEYAVLMGKTGSGKTTLVESICGLRTVSSGKIVLNDRDVTRLKPAQRGIGYVPQDGALFSKMTVREHLAFPLQIRKWEPSEVESRTQQLAELLEIEPLLDRRPQGFSGGESQRVALGRALSFRPSILLLDEPLSALDDETLHHMYELLKRVHEQHNVTVLHITHSRADAVELADRVLSFSEGQIVDLDPADWNGHAPAPRKIEAAEQAPTPTDNDNETTEEEGSSS